MSSKNFYGLTGDVTIDGGILNVANTNVSGNVTSTSLLVSNVATLGTTKTFVVRASGGAYYIDEDPRKSLELHEGQTYIFDLSHSSLASGPHPLEFATQPEGANSSGYTTGISSTGTLGTTGAKKTFVVPAGAPTTLYYYCTVHSGMGGQINISPAAELVVSGRIVASGNVEASKITASANVEVTGNVVASKFVGDGSLLTSVTAATTSGLQVVTDNSPTTTNTIEFTNPTTSLRASSNIVATGNVTADHFIGDGSRLSGIVTSVTFGDAVDTGNVSSNTLLLTNAKEGLVATGNVVTQGKFIGDGSELTGIVTSVNLSDAVDTGNTTSNTVQFTNTSTSLTASGNVEVAGNVVATYFVGDGSRLTGISGGSGGTSHWTKDAVTNQLHYSTGSVGISNTNPAHDLSVGSNLYVDDDATDGVLMVTGNVHGTYFVGDGSRLINLPEGGGSTNWTTSGNPVNKIYYPQNPGTTSVSVGIMNAAPTHTLSVGSNLFIDDAGSNVLHVDGNITAESMFLGALGIKPAYPLDSVTDTGNVTPHTISFTNPTLGITTASNVEIGGALVVGKGTLGGSNLEVGEANLFVNTELTRVGIATDQPAATLHVNGSLAVDGPLTFGTVDVAAQHGLEAITAVDNTTPLTIELQNADTSLVTTGNVEVGGNVITSKDLTVTGNVTTNSELIVAGNVTTNSELIVAGNVFYTNLMSVSVKSNVVTEYTGPHDRPLRKYPEVALTSSAINSDYKGYTIQRSSDYTVTYGTVEKLFNNAEGSDVNSWVAGWNGTSGTYDAVTGEHNGIYHTPGSNNVEGTGAALFTGAPDGEWVSLQIPNGIRLDHVKIRARDHNDGVEQYPKDFEFWGSNNGTDWSLIKSFTNQSWPGKNNKGSYHVNSNILYNRIAMIITKIPINVQNGTHCVLGQLEFYGYEEGSGSLDTTLKTVYNVPATTGTQLELYFDGQDYSDVPSQILDKSGNNLNSTAVGSSVEFNSDYKAFHFPGTPNDATSQATFTLSNPSGAWIHSTAFWLRSSNWNGADIFRAGVYNWDNSGGNNTRLHIVATTDNEIRLDFFGNNVYYGDNGGRIKFAENEWYHLAYTYNGTKISEGAVLYVNGKAVDINLDDVMDRNALNISSNAPLIFDAANVDIGNFRMYNKVLNADQVKELYDFQKDYFLGSKSQVTLYKGHLGVGVTEPSGQFELAGDERIQEYPPRPLTNNDTYIDGHGVFRAYGTNESGIWPEYQAFDDTTNVWYSDSLGEYNNRDYTGTKQLAPETSKGAFIVLQMPYEIVIKQTAFTQQTNGAHVWDQGVYYAKCNPSDKWTAIHTVTDRPANDTTPYVAYITDPRPYKYFAIVITRRYATTASSEGVSIQNFKIFGTPGPTTLDKGSLSLTRSLDVPRVSRYDVDTETPRPEKLVLDFDTTFRACGEYIPTDLSGRENHGLYKGDAHYSYRERAFKFDGSGDYIEIPEFSPAPDGEWIHTISMWIHITPANTGGRIIEVSADSSTSRTLPHLAWGNGTVRWDMYSSACTFSETFETDRWYHVVLQYKGGNLGKNTVLLWKDGVLDADRTYSGDQTAPLAVASSDRVRFMESVSGMISNIKIYNVVLEPSEVQKLYRLGRTGRSMVISDTAVGIGKNPDAQLDVRGTLRTSNMMVDGESITFKNNNKGGTTNDGDDFAASALLNDYSAWTSIFSKSWIGNGQGWGTFWAGNNGALYRRTASDVNPNEYVFVGAGSKRFTFDLDNGDAYFDGSSSAPGYDYAEYFEWEDGNPDNEDRRGYSVVLCEDGKIKKATSDDEPADVFGIVSGTSGIIGDAACYDWQGKYEVDEWGTKVTDEVYQLSWVTEDGVKHSYDDDRVPEGVTVPENVSRRLYHRERITPDYDNTKDYIPRDKRKEWCPVGLLGKVRLRDGCPTNPNWLFLKTIKGKELWLIR